MTSPVPISAMKTYTVLQPLSSHWRAATCAEVDCAAYANGWVTRVPHASELADYITSGVHGRRWTETTAVGSAEREFSFPAGQACFRASQHRLPVERDAIYQLRDGDQRGNPTGRLITFSGPRAWLDDFGEHQQNIADLRQRG